MFQEQETKLALLRNRSKQRYDDSADRPEEIKSEVPSHVNFFQDLEDGHVAHTGVNKDHEQEKKEEKEAYEKKIGYLTYLGQDTDEITGNVQWYNKKPKRLDLCETTGKEIETKVKIFNDPLMVMKKYIESDQKDVKNSKELSKKKDDSPIKKHKKKKMKKEKKKKKDKDKDKDRDKKKIVLEKLREKRLKREREERFRASQLLAIRNGVKPVEVQKPQPKPTIVQKYNSQFNPYLAKQNYPTSSNTN